MKRSIIALFGATLLAGSAAAQNPSYEFGGLVLSNDAMTTGDFFSLSQTQFNFGTARSMAMGGAFASLGGDLASMSINPAGLGMYRRGEIAITPVMNFSRSETPGARPSSSSMPYRDNSKNRFAIGNFGAVFNVYEGQGRLLSVNFGVGYNRMADYNYSYSYEFAGTDRTASIADALAVQLEAGGLTVGGNGITHGGASNWNIDPFFWPAVGAYKTFLVDRNENGVWYPAEIGDNATIDGGAAVRSTGSAGEFDFSVGANWDNKLYFGFTLGIQNLYHKKRIFYGEGYSYGGGNGYNTGDGAVDADGRPLDEVMQSMGLNQTTTVDGTGVNFKLGVIYRPTSSLRIGLAFHSPTFYSLDRRYGLAMSTVAIGPTNADKDDFRPHEYTSDAGPEFQWEDSGDEGYEFVTPTRLMLGFSYTFDDKAVVSVDYERDWYNGIRVKQQPYLPYGPGEEDYKQDFKHYFKGSNMLRAGLEVRPLPVLAVRAGFGYCGSMLRDKNTVLSSPAIRETTYYTAGLGFSLSRTAYIDLAYCYVRNRTTPYMLFYGNKYMPAVSSVPDEIYQSEQYSTNIDRHSVAVTIGFRF